MRRALACLAALAVVAAGWAISSEDPAEASSKWQRGPNRRNYCRRAYRTSRVTRYRPSRTYARRCAPKRRVVRSYAYARPSKRTYYAPSRTTYYYRPATTTYTTPPAKTYRYRAPAVATVPSRPAASVAAATAAPSVVGSTDIAPVPAPTTRFVPISPMAAPTISPSLQFSPSCSNYT